MIPQLEAAKALLRTSLFRYLAVAAIAFCAGFLLHHPSERVVTKTVTQTVVQTSTQTNETQHAQQQVQIEYRDRIVYVKVKEQSKDVSVDRTITKNKDGSEVITEHEHSGTQTTEHVNAGETKSNNTTSVTQLDDHIDTKSTTQSTTKTATETTREPVQPGWQVGLLVGLDVRSLSLKGGNLNAPVVGGLQASRRLIGPVWAGAWGMSSGNAGLSFTLEF